MVLTHTGDIAPGMYFVTHVEHGNEEDWGIDDLELFKDEYRDWIAHQESEESPSQ